MGMRRGCGDDDGMFSVVELDVADVRTEPSVIDFGQPLNGFFSTIVSAPEKHPLIPSLSPYPHFQNHLYSMDPKLGAWPPPGGTPHRSPNLLNFATGSRHNRAFRFNSQI